MCLEGALQPRGVYATTAIARLTGGALDEVLDQCSRDGHGMRQVWEIIWREPSRVFDFFVCDVDLALHPVRDEPHHERMWEGVRLTPEIPQIRQFDPDLFFHFAVNGFFERLAGLDETGQGRVDAFSKVRRPAQKHFVSALHEHDHGRC